MLAWQILSAPNDLNDKADLKILFFDFWKQVEAFLMTQIWQLFHRFFFAKSRVTLFRFLMLYNNLMHIFVFKLLNISLSRSDHCILLNIMFNVLGLIKLTIQYHIRNLKTEIKFKWSTFSARKQWHRHNPNILYSSKWLNWISWNVKIYFNSDLRYH